MSETKSLWKHKFVQEFIDYWINVLYLAIFFSVFTSYQRLILADYHIPYANWGISLIKALVLAKVIMIGGLMHFGRNLEDRSLILPTFVKTFAFTVWVALFAVVESAIRGFLQGKGMAGVLDHLLMEGTYQFFARCLVVFCAFIPFFAFKELARVLCEGDLWKLFFRRTPLTELELGSCKNDTNERLETGNEHLYGKTGEDGTMDPKEA